MKIFSRPVKVLESVANTEVPRLRKGSGKSGGDSGR